MSGNKTFWLALFAFLLAVAAIVLSLTARHGGGWTDIVLPALIAGFMVILMLEHRPGNG
jgi:hypothetical protein